MKKILVFIFVLLVSCNVNSKKFDRLGIWQVKGYVDSLNGELKPTEFTSIRTVYNDSIYSTDLIELNDPPYTDKYILKNDTLYDKEGYRIFKPITNDSIYVESFVSVNNDKWIEVWVRKE